MSVISFFVTLMSMIRFDFNHDDKEKDVGEKNINHAKVKKDNAQDFFDEIYCFFSPSRPYTFFWQISVR